MSEGYTLGNAAMQVAKAPIRVKTKKTKILLNRGLPPAVVRTPAWLSGSKKLDARLSTLLPFIAPKVSLPHPSRYFFTLDATMLSLILLYVACGSTPLLTSCVFIVYGRPSMIRFAYASPIPLNAFS